MANFKVETTRGGETTFLAELVHISDVYFYLRHINAADCFGIVTVRKGRRQVFCNALARDCIALKQPDSEDLGMLITRRLERK